MNANLDQNDLHAEESSQSVEAATESVPETSKEPSADTLISGTPPVDTSSRQKSLEWLRILADCPVALRAMAGTRPDFPKFQETLRQWKELGYPDQGLKL